MNERIRELLIEAGYAAPALAGRANKLAEIIVQECLLAISKTSVTDEEIPVMVKCHNQVAEYFGIK